jgi:hypothetical protein
MHQVGFISSFQMTGKLTALDWVIRQVQNRNRCGRCVGFQAAADLEAAHVGQMEIKDDDVRDLCRKAKPFRTVGCVSDFESRLSEGLIKSIPPPFVSNDDQSRLS